MHRTPLALILIGGCILHCADYDLLDDTPPESVTLGIEEVTDTSVALAWTECEDDRFRNYEVYYSEDQTVDTNSTLVDTMAFSFDVTKTVYGLMPETRYYFRVFVNTTNGLMSASNEVDTWTLRDSRTIELFEPDSVTDTSVALVWSRSRDESFRYYLLYLDTAGAVDTTDDPLHSIRRNLVDDTTYRVEDLLRGKEYTIRVHVKGPRGFLASSNIKRITTPDGLPEPVEVTIIDSSVTDVSMTIRWGMNTDDDFRRYIIVHDTVPTIDTLTRFDLARENITAVQDIGDTVATIDGLERSCTHYVTVYVQDNFGLAVASNVDSATTGDGLPEPVRVEIIDSTVGDTSMTLRWTASTADDFRRYIIVCDTLPRVDSLDTLDTSLDHITVFETIEDTLQSIGNLLRDHRYYVTVYVEDSSGFAVPGNVDSASTPDGLPQPVSLELISADPDSVVISWSQNADSDFKHYLVYVEEADYPDTAAAAYDTLGRDDTGYVFTHLIDTVRYAIVILVEDSSGFRIASNPARNHPVILRVTSVSLDKVTLSWNRTLSESFEAIKLYRDTLPEVTENSTTFAGWTTTDEYTTLFEDTEIDSGEVYYYRLFHYESDSSGSGVGVSNLVGVMVE